MTSLRSARPKRKRTVNVHLSKLELQEYLDDGYTVADIAKDCNVSPAAIDEKIRKLGIKKPRGTRREAMAKRKPASPRGRPSKDSSKRPGVPKSPRRSSPRQASRPRVTPVEKLGSKKRAIRPTKTRDESQSKTSNRKGEEDSKEENDPSLNTVVVQVIKDNPNDDIDQIHSILKWMGFDFDKSYVEEHMQKTVVTRADKRASEARKGKTSDGDGGTKGKSEQAPRKGQPVKGKRRRGRPRKETGTGEEGKKETAVKKEKTEESGKDDAEHENKEKKEPAKEDGELQEEEGEQKEGKQLTEEGNLSSNSKQSAEPSANEDGTETSKESKENKEDANEKPKQPEEVKKKRPARTRRKPKKIKDESEGGDGATTNETGEDSTTDAGTEDKESVKPKKRGRKRKQTSDKVDGVYMTKRGRPSLMLSEENLKHCMDSGLPRQKIAEVFGTCMRSISRYLELHKMRKSDKFCNCTDAELDEMVSKICKEHPDWGQLHIQKDLEKKGLYFRRAQIRNSVRRVDPIGIELRKLNNLKRRWNRGSLKKLNTILPADGINMTSTYSFLCQPPRTGLNGLSQEDSVRLLKDIVYSSKREYVEYPPPFKTEEDPAEEDPAEESSAESSKEALADSSSKEETTESSPMQASAQSSSMQGSAESSMEPSAESSSMEPSAESSMEPSAESSSKEASTESSSMQMSEQASAELSMDVSAVSSSKDAESSDELIRAVQMVEIKPEDQPPPEKAEEEQPPSCAESSNQNTTPPAEEAATPDQDEYWKKRLQNMVMSNKRAGRQVAAQRRGPEVKIPKEELQECMDQGYSSTRIAMKFNTSKHNVRRHLDLYKLGKARRFEILTDASIDALVVTVMREHSVLKGREVYDKIKESGLQIRKEDIRKSLCRLHPKGLHRGDPSILKRSCWEAAVAKQHEEVTYVMQEQRAIVDGNEEDVIVLNTDELAKLINHEGGIVLVDEHGNIMNASEEGYQQAQGEADETAAMHRQQEGGDGTQEESRQENVFINSHEQFNTNGVPAADGGDTEAVAYQYQGGHGGEETGASSEDAQEINQTYNTTTVADNSGMSVATQQTTTETATVADSAGRVATDSHSDSGTPGTGMPSGDEQGAAVDALMEAHKDPQAVPTSQENEISAIILEFNVPHEQGSGEGAPPSGQYEQLAATQQHSQEVYFVQGEQENEEVRRLVVVNDSTEKMEGTTEGDQKQEHIIMQVTEDGSATEGSSEQSSSLTSLNTVQPNQLSAQVLLQLDRIAQNLHTQEVKEEPVPVSAEAGNNP